MGAYCAWALAPPFPSPIALIDTPQSALLAEFGPSTHRKASTDLERRLAGLGRTLAWDRSRGIAVWSLEAYFVGHADDPTALPMSVSRCLHADWAGNALDSYLPCMGIAKTHVMAPNPRLERP